MKLKTNLITIFATALITHYVVAAAQPNTVWVPIQSHTPDVSMAKPGAVMNADEALHITVSLQVRDKAGLDALTSGVTAGASPAPLTSAQFQSKYAPADDAVSAVVAYLSKNGFSNITVASNHLLITANGNVGAAKSAFHVNMQHFSVGGRDAYANVNDPVVPKELGTIVLAVQGLQNVHMPHTMLKAKE
ncbi:protease pro-enzyme activation domain-containing protein [Solimicrobium silvestre]|uniref:Pro-kumamolisin, activation domain n=1 Tax=Solimicrobium silvestre TaxID=2099400 RepID=A0A2S9H3B7_9BURK|nr:protease pro-enzyme activation domain-containing protein [Solimicrobium silvestre]PRC94356.1 Pro-kumamolisin, activation domain [Solimicrobium silvestre]